VPVTFQYRNMETEVKHEIFEDNLTSSRVGAMYITCINILPIVWDIFDTNDVSEGRPSPVFLWSPVTLLGAAINLTIKDNKGICQCDDDPSCEWGCTLSTQNAMCIKYTAHNEQCTTMDLHTGRTSRFRKALEWFAKLLDKILTFFIISSPKLSRPPLYLPK
jgi:hypothetical protein